MFEKVFDAVAPDKDIFKMAIIDRVSCIESKKPAITLALDDFNFYLGQIKHKSIKGLSNEEFIKIKNEFILAIEEDICKFHKFVNDNKCD